MIKVQWKTQICFWFNPTLFGLLGLYSHFVILQAQIIIFRPPSSPSLSLPLFFHLKMVVPLPLLVPLPLCPKSRRAQRTVSGFSFPLWWSWILIYLHNLKTWFSRKQTTQGEIISSLISNVLTPQQVIIWRSDAPPHLSSWKKLVWLP